MPSQQPRPAEIYTTAQPDGTYVTTTTKETTRYREDEVYSCGLGRTDSSRCLHPMGILRMCEIFLVLVTISLITSVYGPGPFKGILFGQTMLLIFAGLCLCVSFIFLIVYFFALDESHLDFWPWSLTDLAFSATASIFFFIMTVIEGYYATGSWANNCNDIGSDGFLHNGCRFVYEWAFAALMCFLLGCLYGVSALFAHRSRFNENDRRYTYE
ncbi:unnamed protein product, partial [Mesorhabditis spiculigera]